MSKNAYDVAIAPLSPNRASRRTTWEGEGRSRGSSPRLGGCSQRCPSPLYNRRPPDGSITVCSAAGAAAASVSQHGSQTGEADRTETQLDTSVATGGSRGAFRASLHFYKEQRLAVLLGKSGLFAPPPKKKNVGRCRHVPRSKEDPGSRIIGCHFVEGSSGSWILSTQFLRDPGSCLEKNVAGSC